MGTSEAHTTSLSDQDVSGLRRRLDGALRTILLTAVIGVPVVFTWGITHDPFNVPKLALLIVVAAAALGVRATLATLGRPLPVPFPLVWPALAIALPLLVSWAVNPHRSWTLFGQYTRYEGLIPYLAIAVFGVLCAEAFADRPRRLAWALAAAGAGVGAYAFVQALGVNPTGGPLTDFAFSTIGHSNFLGGFLAIVLPVSLGLWGERSRPRLAAAATAAVAVGLVVSFSQGAWFAAVAGGGVFVAQRARPGAISKAAWAVAGLAAVAGFAAVIYSLVDPFGPLVGDTTRARGLWWQGAFAMGLESPIWGHGPNAFALEGVRFRPPLDALSHGNSVADAPHSVPLSSWANAGLLGLAGFVAVLVWALRRRPRAARTHLGAGFFAAGIAYFVQSLVSLDSLVLAFSLFVVLVGLAATTSSRPTAGSSRPASRGVMAAVVAASLLLVGSSAWWATRFVRADHLARTGHRAFLDDRPADAIAAFEEVLRLRPDPFYRELYGEGLGAAALDRRDGGDAYIVRMMETFAFVEGFPKPSALTAEATWLHRWSAIDPGADGAALHRYLRRLRLDPYNPVLRSATAEVLLHMNRPSDALDVLRPAIELIERRFPMFASAYHYLWSDLAIAQDVLGRSGEARAALERVEEITSPLERRGSCAFLVASALVHDESAHLDLRLACPETMVDLLDPGRGAT